MADIEVEVEVHGRTDRALFVSRDGENPSWVPRSQISDYCGDEDSPESIFIPQWLAEEKGLV